MKIVLATGIYPPHIGGPATYVQKLAERLAAQGEDVTVITYGEVESGSFDSAQDKKLTVESEFPVIHVSKKGGSVVRWNRYAKALKKYGHDADVVYCFSSVSVGVPLRLARLRKPKKILRLGGDFLWERYTDMGGRRGLRSFYLTYPGAKRALTSLLKPFDHVVFSTVFQERLYEFLLKRMPSHSVIENAIVDGKPTRHKKHDPLRLLFLGRFVRFKNLGALIGAATLLPYVHLTLVGEGPVRKAMMKRVHVLGLSGRISFLPPVSGQEKDTLLADHDVLVLPSITELSPHVAVEARVAGLPVLLTEETGLSANLSQGMVISTLRTAEDITRAVLEAERGYDQIAKEAAAAFDMKRSWDDLADETMDLLKTIATSH